MPKKRLKFVFGVGIILIVFSWQAIVGFQENQTYYITVQELVKGPEYEKRLRVGGIVMPGSILRESGSLTFRLSQEEDSIPVVYVGMETPPDTFVGGSEGIIEGRYADDGVFHAEKIQARCTSKYEAGPGLLPARSTNPPSEPFMNQVGSLMLIAALALATYAVVCAFTAGRTKNKRLLQSAERATYGFLGMVTLAVVAVEIMILKDSFYVGYVASHSNRDLPLFFKISVLWSGQEGSLLFWTWLMAIYCGVVVFQNRRRNRQLLPYVIGISMFTAAFFTSLTLFVANPFTELALAEGAGVAHRFFPPDGLGLNPILQHHAMVIHPPMLYLGFTGFVIPFAFAMGALITRQPGENWIRTTRRWTMVPWLFLGIGILLGGGWAYATLGWGGYWGWDPVENASLLPWLSGTAFLHSVMIQERRGMLKVWNMVLVILTFFLCIFGTFLTRSGIISSVHAFAQSPLGTYFAVFLVIIVGFSVVTVLSRLDYLRSDNQLDSMLARESGFMFNNWILLAAVFAILCGTLFPDPLGSGQGGNDQRRASLL